MVPVRLPPELARLLERLFTELHAARADFEAAGPTVRGPIVRSLRAVLSFLTRFPAQVDAVGSQVPLGHLLAALLSLDEGKVEALLKPVKRSGRAPEGLAHDTTKALAVHFVGLLASAGAAQRQAEGARVKVARVLLRAGVRRARGGGDAQITARTVRTWCEELAADVGGRTRAGSILADLNRCGFCRPADGAPVEEGDLLKVLGEALTALAGEKPPRPGS